MLPLRIPSRRWCVQCSLSRQQRRKEPIISKTFSTSTSASYPRIRRGAKQDLSATAPASYDGIDATFPEQGDADIAFDPPARRWSEPDEEHVRTDSERLRPKLKSDKETYEGIVPWDSIDIKEGEKPTQKQPAAGAATAVSEADSKKGVERLRPKKTPGAYTWDVPPATKQQLNYANELFRRHKPRFHRSALEFSHMKETGMPEVAFVGRSNVGKSSLLNSVMAANRLARTSANPGHTRHMNSYSIGNGRISLIDMPGYGYNSKKEWGGEIMEYLRNRKQLRRTFVLIDAMHGIKETDEMLLDAISRGGISYQIVLSKADRIAYDETEKNEGENQKYLKRGGNLYYHYDHVRRFMEKLPGVTGFGEILATSTKFKPTQQERGINDVRWAILRATGLDDV